MSNTRTARPAQPKAQPKRKTHKWADFKAEAERRAGNTPARPKLDPFVIDDVEPPIIIQPPDEKATLIISEQVGMLQGINDFSEPVARVLPLLRALCGSEFPRIWALLPSEGTTEAVYILLQALMNQFEAALRDALEAAEQPGGSEASSD